MADPRHDWGPLVGDLSARKERALEMGGEKLVERQRSLGKLTVRERLDLLLDPGTWVEYALLAD
ncbi:MAG: methylmalonyl-CoA decarboxylase subunit alpha, partial [Actinomycetota bacterium]|nr:methylmalonyl-CoA decarboxylase subunit alpha [Actinomycetota bacterium]